MRINLIISPTDKCNMGCSYCFHRGECLQDKTLSVADYSQLIRKALETRDSVHVVWHGGEPLMMGKEFFRAIIDDNSELNQAGDVVTSVIQTNGTLLDRDFAELLKMGNIRPSLSYDGPLSHRLFRSREQEVLAGMQNAVKAFRDIGAIKVVHPRTAGSLKVEYEWFKEKRVNLQLNFLVGEKMTSLVQDAYMQDILTFFDYWLEDEDCNIHIDPFERILSLFTMSPRRGCEFGSCLNRFLGVSSDGSIYPCARPWSKAYRLGSINSIETIEEPFLTNEFRNLIKGAIERRSNCELLCEWYEYCQGGCNSDALLTGSISRPSDLNCQIFRAIAKRATGDLPASARNPYVKRVFANA